jgi:hypothetical protein
MAANTGTSPPRSSPHRFVVVGHPGHKRVELFQAALARAGRRPAAVVAYRDLLDRRASLADAVRRGTVVRLESPGQDFEVEKRLIALGAAEPETEYPDASSVTRTAALRLTPDRGRLLYPRQWYRGFRALLRRLDRELAECPGARWMNAPGDVAVMFDKPACQRIFADAGLPVPAGLGPVRSFDGLLERMRQARRWRVFVKLAHGSSASGAVAFATNGERVRATTTAELVREGRCWAIYNSRRIRTYESPAEVAVLLDALIREGVQVEDWVPKAATDGRSFDLRVVVVAGRARHVVVRTSDTPLTNLHLLNARGDPDAVRRRVGRGRWAEAMRTCERAAALFPGTWYAGVDLLFAPGFRWHGLLEINAFGDLLPGAVWEGRDTYETELAAFAEGGGP